MDFSLKAGKTALASKSDCLVIPAIDDAKFKALGKELDALHNNIVSQFLKSKDISLEKGKSRVIDSPANGQRLLIIGLGKDPSFADYRKALQSAHKQLANMPIKNASIALSHLNVNNLNEAQLIEQAAEILEGQSYQYSETLSKKAKAPSLKKISIIASANNKELKSALAQGKATGLGVNLAKELGNLPANICTPSYLAKQAQALAKAHPKLSAKALSETEMKKLKMGALLSVAAGSDEPAKLVVMEYQGASKKSEQPYVLVGKGVTFDSGGISIKPGAAMDEMKYDMCGAASVFGTMKAVAELELPINVVGLVGAVENMPSGRATKPGDVVTSMAGKTIEVLNTDAEGRLVLCDVLSYAERFKPKSVIDIATLTGAAIVALGKHATAMYSNNDVLAQNIQQAGNKTYDRVWQMPMWEEYQQQLKSNFADLGNIGGPQAGSVTAACFLSRFTESYHWAHLDIAGPAWLSGAAKGATGRPVSLLTQYLIDQV